jgi:hypothetical protein
MLLGKPMEFRQEFVRQSVAYVKKMPAAKNHSAFSEQRRGVHLELGPTVTRESRLKGSALTFLMDRKGASAESCGTSSSDMETTPVIFLIGVWNLARLSAFSMGTLTRIRSIHFGPNVPTKMSSLRSADVARTAIPPADLRRYLRIRVLALRPHSPNKSPDRSDTACRTDFITRQLPRQAAVV